MKASPERIKMFITNITAFKNKAQGCFQEYKNQVANATMPPSLFSRQEIKWLLKHRCAIANNDEE